MNAQSTKAGDMVVCSNGSVGLLMEIRIGARGAKVQFVNNGPLHSYNWKGLKRATMDEITDAGLHGVGCNQSDD